MKKWIALLLCLSLLASCAAAETAAEPAAPQMTMKTFPVYCNSLANIWREDFPVYFADGAEDLPLIDLADWKDMLVYLYMSNDYMGENTYGLTLEITEEEKKVKLTRETGFPMVADFENGTLSFLDYVGFNTPANSRYMDLGGFPETMNGQPFLLQNTRSRTLYGDVTVVNLREYEIPMYAQDGKYLLPMQTLAAFTLADNAVSLYYNGQALYAAPVQIMVNPRDNLSQALSMYGLLTPELIRQVQTMEGTIEEKVNFLLEEVSKMSEMGKQIADQYKAMLEASLYLHYISAPKAARSEALVLYGFNELALEMDCFYGLKDAHNIHDFRTFFLQNDVGLNLLEADASKADRAITDLTMFWFDDGHSTFLSPSYLSESEIDPNYGYGFLARNEFSTGLQMLRAQHPEAALPYFEVGDTAYVTLDSFVATQDEKTGIVDYYALAEAGTLPPDTLGIVSQAHQQITREDSPIKNVVLDLSNNGGGMAPAAFFTLGWFLGEANYSYINTFTGAQATHYFRSDVNLDHQFDENDTLAGRGLKLYCLTSPRSFSCGNMLPWVFKESGAVTLLGRVSGGGSCVVNFDTTAWGTSFRYSSSKRLAFVKNGAYYDVDQGVEPDYIINDYAHFYDREALTEFIHGLF